MVLEPTGFIEGTGEPAQTVLADAAAQRACEMPKIAITTRVTLSAASRLTVAG